MLPSGFSYMVPYKISKYHPYGTLNVFTAIE